VHARPLRDEGHDARPRIVLEHAALVEAVSASSRPAPEPLPPPGEPDPTTPLVEGDVIELGARLSA